MNGTIYLNDGGKIETTGISYDQIRTLDTGTCEMSIIGNIIIKINDVKYIELGEEK